MKRWVGLGWAVFGCSAQPPLEVCNGLDDDGDGVIDESAQDALDLYLDVDEDGFGAGAARRGCPQPGLSWTPGDCDDLDGTVHPGASERCDGVDQDCDGAPSPLEVDADGDGWSPCRGDCDDTDPSMHPYADELCDGIDQDCDGDIAEEFDLDGDGFSVCEGDCGPLDPAVYPGAPAECEGPDRDCAGRPYRRLRVPEGYPSVQAAFSAADPGDLVCLSAGLWPHDGELPQVRDQGRGIEATTLEIRAGRTLESTGSFGSMADLTVRWAAPGLNAPWMNARRLDLTRVLLDVSACTPASPCATPEGLVTEGPATWTEVDVRGGTLIPGPTDHLDVFALDDVTAWRDGSVSGFDLDLRSCLFGLRASIQPTFLASTGIRLHDITVRPCGRGGGTSVTLSVGPSSSIEDVRFEGSFANTGLYLGGGTIRRMTLPTSAPTSPMIAGRDVLVEDVEVPAGTLLSRPTRAVLRRVNLGREATLAPAGDTLTDVTLVDVTAVRPLVTDPESIAGLTVRRGSFGTLAVTSGATPIHDLDLRGARFTDALITGPSEPRRLTLAGNTLEGPLLGPDALGVSFATLAGNTWLEAPFQTPGQHLSHAVFAYNAGDGGLPLELSASYLHRHDDASDAWSPRTSDNLSSGDPRFLDISSLDPAAWDLTPAPDSPLRDVGPSGCLDRDGTPCDVGASGGPR